MNRDLYEQLKDSLSTQDIKEYKRIGETMFNSIDFVNTTIDKGNVPSLDYIIEKQKQYGTFENPRKEDDDDNILSEK